MMRFTRSGSQPVAIHWAAIHWAVIRWTAWVSIVLTWVLCSMPSASLGQDEDVYAKQGRAALAGGDYERALESFRAGSETAQDPDQQTKYLFYQAVTLQKQGNLEASVGLYKEYLRRKPGSGAALNNLAQVYAEMGSPEPAEKLFRRAIALNDSRNAFYRQNYAEFLDAQGRWKDSTATWTRLIDGNPRAESPHRAMMDRYLASAPADRPWRSLQGREQHRRQSRGEEMVGYLWGRWEDGQPVRAVSGALDALADADSWPPDLRRELLTVVAVGLAAQRYDARKFLASETAKRLSTLTGAPRIEQGVNELLQLHDPDNPKLDPFEYRWWKSGDLEEDPPRGVWPADGFLRLIRSLGRGYQQDENSDLAASYFRLAADFRGDDVDPEAISDLVTLYAGENRLEQVGEIAQEYEQRLFGGKVQAYRGSKTEKIFDYHRTLGGIYSITGDWGDENTVTSAIFQLDRALDMYRRLEDEAPATAQQKAQYTPELNSLLAKGYESTDRIEKSYEVRIAAAETYQRNGDTEAAKEILRPIATKPPPSTADDRIKTRYSEVLTQVEPQDLQLDWKKTPSLDLSNSREKLRRDSSSGVRPFNRGLRYSETDAERAAKQFNLALEKDPKLDEAYEALTRLYLEQKDYDKALETAEKWVVAEPEHDQAHLYRFMAAESTGDSDKSAEALATYGRVDPKGAAKIHLEKAALALRSGDTDAAKVSLYYSQKLAGDDQELAATMQRMVKQLERQR